MNNYDFHKFLTCRDKDIDLNVYYGAMQLALWVLPIEYYEILADFNDITNGGICPCLVDTHEDL